MQATSLFFRYAPIAAEVWVRTKDLVPGKGAGAALNVQVTDTRARTGYGRSSTGAVRDERLGAVHARRRRTA